jgi:ADP-ribosyl-[dinitrogen reductase] hydrolase
MSETTNPRLDRAQGCLLGQLAGDTLGGLVEFCRPEAIKARYPAGVREMAKGGTWNNIAGQPTDDSEMALALARMLVRDHRYEQKAALDAYLGWWKHAWDRGSTISQSLRAGATGKTQPERLYRATASANQSSQSNGSLMRISPLGIFGAGRHEEVIEWAKADSQITHPNPVCVASVAVYVAAISHAIETGADGSAIAEVAIKESRRQGIKTVFDALVAARTKLPSDYVTQMGWVLIALQNAFYQLRFARSVEDGIADTISRGGDTDTNAAIAGALLGAVHGRSGIPDRWVKTLQDCRSIEGSGTFHPVPEFYWPCDVLELAEGLLETGSKHVPECRVNASPEAESVSR